MDEKTEEQIVGIKHSLNQTLGESIHLADSQRELKKEMAALKKDCDSRFKIFKKLSFRSVSYTHLTLPTNREV